MKYAITSQCHLPYKQNAIYRTALIIIFQVNYCRVTFLCQTTMHSMTKKMVEYLMPQVLHCCHTALSRKKCMLYLNQSHTSLWFLSVKCINYVCAIGCNNTYCFLIFNLKKKESFNLKLSINLGKVLYLNELSYHTQIGRI